MAVKKLNTIKFDDYKDLHKTFEYDKAKATRLAEAMTEVTTLQARLKYLEALLAENVGLSPFLWKQEDGTVTAIHDLEDNHLKNIIRWVTRHGRTVKPELVAEARSRGFTVEDYTEKPRAIEAFVEDDEDDEYEEWM